MAALIRPALIIALYALLLPIFGPLLDHHFVEWQHQHAHIYAAGGRRPTATFTKPAAAIIIPRRMRLARRPPQPPAWSI